MIDNARHLAIGSLDSNYLNYGNICEMARRSKYLSSLPPLPVHCVPLGEFYCFIHLESLFIIMFNVIVRTDGDSTSLPLIFEDRYQDNGDANRRRTGSDPHITSGHCSKNSKSSGLNINITSNININNNNNNSSTALVMTNGTKTKECSCGINNNNNNNNYSMEPLPKLNSTNMIGVMTPRFALGGDILQASLTIIPAAAQNGLRGKTLSRHSVSNVLESDPQWDGFREIYVPGNGGGTLPTRHSKSLDQLETQQLIVNSLPRQNTMTNQQISLLSKLPMSALTYYQPPHNQQQQLQRYSKKNATAEDLLKNITEFKEKYKNPIDSNKTLAQLTNDLHPNKLTNGQLNQVSTTIFPKQIHLNSNTNVLTLNRVTHSSNNPKTDYVHELKQNNNNHNPVGGNNQHSCYYNSLPKHAGMGIPPRNSFPPIRGKKSGKLSSKSPKSSRKVMNTNTIPRSNSSQALKNGAVNHKDSRVNKSNKKNGKYMNESSSTDQSTTITPKRRSKRLLSSRSVPFKLELLEMEPNGPLPPGFSESLPNLAPPPPAFSNSPPLSMKSRNRTSSSESTSSLSEQSGWVSSNRSSLPSSPETLKNEQRAFNGEQLRKKLLKLLQEQPQRKGSVEKKRSNSGRVVNGFSQHKRHSSGNAIERNKSLTFNGKSSAWESLHNDWVEIPPIGGSPQNKQNENSSGDRRAGDRQLTLDSRGKGRRTRKPSEKSKSDFDLTSLPMDQPFEDLRLPPPQQFQDIAPLPPDEFRDPPKTVNDEKKMSTNGNGNEKKAPGAQMKTMKSHQPLIHQQSNPVQSQTMSIQPQIVEAIDNPLYHVYEIKRQPGPARPFVKSQSNNELIGMVRAASVNDKMISQAHHPHLKNLSKPSSPAQNSDRSDSETKKESPMMLMEFEKCREEFRKQINYSGSIYSDFTKLASEMPYFHISDEYRTFSPGGVHLIICVHGLDGNSADLRLVRTYLELGLPGAHLEFL